MKVTADMLRRQAVFAARSVRQIIRNPNVGREFPRLLASRGRSTTTLRCPWLPFRLIDELESMVGPSSRVFEYGGGGSTLWFLDRGAEVVTVEHEPFWAARLRSLVDSPRWFLLERGSDDAYATYVEAISDFPECSFDVVIVDGRERVRCAHRALPYVRPGGWLIVDDVDRTRYAAGLSDVGWPRRDVVGFAPAKPSLAHTAVFVRPTTSG